jgi:hypothetical protein
MLQIDLPERHEIDGYSKKLYKWDIRFNSYYKASSYYLEKKEELKGMNSIAFTWYILWDGHSKIWLQYTIIEKTAIWSSTWLHWSTKISIIQTSPSKIKIWLCLLSKEFANKVELKWWQWHRTNLVTVLYPEGTHLVAMCLKDYYGDTLIIGRPNLGFIP